ncbi:MAG: shikimate dehydrogenase [Acidimicrobiia bacterium]|nr:shikimate dehydrogenase [Acidimicrobiia bacterium]
MLTLVVLGDPVAHSLSPRMHAAALEAAGIEGTYEAIQVDATAMGIMIARLHHGRLDGANVTMPHKRLAAVLADHLEPMARRTLAVNTLSVDDGRVVGDNTDVGGFTDAAEWNGLPRDAPVLVLGSGGAAAAAMVAFEGRVLHISARRPEAVKALSDRLGVAATPVAWGASVPGAVVVNCTPLGTVGEELPGSLVGDASGYFETVYAGGPTPAQTEAVTRGIPVASGLDLLLAQGARSFTVWTGVAAPIEAMRTAIGA